MSHSVDGRRDSNVSSELQTSGGLQSSYLRRTRQSVPNVKERFGSNCSLATLTGSTTNLLDQTRLLSMQEDAHCRRITVEVMKRCLYKSVVPCRRRAMNRLNSMTSSAAVSASGNGMSSRLTVSVPVTPIRSKVTSPVPSPTNSCMFFGPMTELAVAADADFSDRGLTSLFRPRPRILRASCSQLDSIDRDDDSLLDDAIAMTTSRSGNFLTASGVY